MVSSSLQLLQKRVSSKSILGILQTLRSNGIISEEWFKAVKPIGSQHAQFFGLTKVHKRNTPLRPIVSMPGSAYQPSAKQIAM